MDAMVKQFLELPTTCISDAMDGMNNMDPSIKPLKEVYRVAGRAVTVKVPVGQNKAVLQALREAKPGEVLVVDAKGDQYRAIAGDFVIGMAQTLGIAGVVVDGVIRDISGIKQLNFPIFSKGTTIAAGSKASVGEVNVSISCGGTTVNPGDIIVGDSDGVVVIPKQMEKEVLTKTIEKLEKEQQRDREVSGNREEILTYLNKVLD